MGPLMGIYSCLLESGSDLNFITACDIPVMDIDLIGKMLNLARDAEIVVPIKGEDEYEPLYGIYRKSVTQEAEMILGEGKRKIAELFSRCNTRLIDFNSGDWYHNLNFRDDYLRYTGKI
jgi:molybdopterin-guanine dinucleotide biosynthesis protein A